MRFLTVVKEGTQGVEFFVDERFIIGQGGHTHDTSYTYVPQVNQGAIAQQLVTFLHCKPELLLFLRYV